MTLLLKMEARRTLGEGVFMQRQAIIASGRESHQGNAAVYTGRANHVKDLPSWFRLAGMKNYKVVRQVKRERERSAER